MNLLLNVTYWYHILEDSKIYEKTFDKALLQTKLKYSMKSEIF